MIQSQTISKTLLLYVIDICVATLYHDIIANFHDTNFQIGGHDNSLPKLAIVMYMHTITNKSVLQM